MSTPTPPLPAKLIVSVIHQAGHEEGTARLTEATLGALQDHFGAADLHSPSAPFTYTRYYHREMGETLERFFLSFAELVPREKLPTIKLITNSIEMRFSREGKRRVNLDPGLLSLENLILATGKNYAHRIYLGQGIFAEVTLLFRGGDFEPLPWTYPDYASRAERNLFLEIRTKLLDHYRQARRDATERAP